MRYKEKIKKKHKQAYCVKLCNTEDGKRYVVWPCKIGERHLMVCAIGLGRTAAEAWCDAARNITKRKDVTP